MQNLIKELETPTHNSEGISIGPSNLHRRAANAIRQLLSVKLQNMQVFETMQKELNHFRNEYDKTNNASSTITGNSTASIDGPHAGPN